MLSLWTHFGVEMHYLIAWSESLRRENLAKVLSFIAPLWSLGARLAEVQLLQYSLILSDL